MSNYQISREASPSFGGGRGEAFYKIGVIGKPHGVDGEVALNFTDDIFDRTDADHLMIEVDGLLVPFFIEEYRFRSDEVALMRFEDITTQQEAQELTGCDVYFPRELSDSVTDEASWPELVGYALVDAANNNKIGVIRGVDDSTMNILFDVTTPTGDDILIPASEELIEEIDKETRVVRTKIPQGLI